MPVAGVCPAAIELSTDFKYVDLVCPRTLKWRSLGVKPGTVATRVPCPSIWEEVGWVASVIHLELLLPLFTSEFPMSIFISLSLSLAAFLFVTSISDTLYTPGSWSLHHGFPSPPVWVQLRWPYSGSLLPSMARLASPLAAIEDWVAVPLNATLMRDAA